MLIYKVILCIAILAGAFSTEQAVFYNDAVKDIEERLEIDLHDLADYMNAQVAYTLHRENLETIGDCLERSNDGKYNRSD